jgi:hypothetical protein
MIHNHKLLNIILPSIVIGSYFTYNKYYRNNFQYLENKNNEEIELIINKYDNPNGYNKHHLIELYGIKQNQFPNGSIFIKDYYRIIDLTKKYDKSIMFDYDNNYHFYKYIILNRNEFQQSIIDKLSSYKK